MRLTDQVRMLEKRVAELLKLVLNLRAAGGAGEANTASNIGAGGVGLYDSKVGVDLRFRNINAGSSKVTVTLDNPNHEVDIEVAEINIKLDDLGTPDNNTDLDSTITEHGLLPKLPNDVGLVLSGIGTWIAAGGGAAAFLDLTDVPASYATHGDKYVKVNAAENALEFGRRIFVDDAAPGAGDGSNGDVWFEY